MRVLHITEAAVGGVATYLNELLLPQLRHSKHVGLLLAQSECGNLDEELLARATVFTYRRTGRNLFSVLALIFQTSRVVGSFRPDIIHVHSSIAGLCVRMFAMRVPVVYSPHGWSFDTDTSAVLRQLYSGVEKLLLRRCSLVICVSQHERRAARAVGMPKSALRVVETGIAKERLACEKSVCGRGPIKLLFVGRFDRQKGLDWFLRVFEQLPQQDFELQLVGGEVRGASDEIVLLSNMRVEPWVAAEDLDGYYDQADLLVVPSRWETFGLVVVEALRRGCPVLASDRGALPDLLRGGECGLNLPWGDTKAWINCLQSMDHQTLAYWGINARQHYLRRFTSDSMLHGMDRAYWIAMNGQA